MYNEDQIKLAYAYGASIALQEAGMDKMAADEAAAEMAEAQGPSAAQRAMSLMAGPIGAAYAAPKGHGWHTLGNVAAGQGLGAVGGGAAGAGLGAGIGALLKNPGLGAAIGGGLGGLGGAIYGNQKGLESGVQGRGLGQ